MHALDSSNMHPLTSFAVAASNHQLPVDLSGSVKENHQPLSRLLLLVISIYSKKILIRQSLCAGHY